MLPASEDDEEVTLCAKWVPHPLRQHVCGPTTSRQSVENKLVEVVDSIIAPNIHCHCLGEDISHSINVGFQTEVQAQVACVSSKWNLKSIPWFCCHEADTDRDSASSLGPRISADQQQIMMRTRNKPVLS